MDSKVVKAHFTKKKKKKYTSTNHRRSGGRTDFGGRESIQECNAGFHGWTLHESGRPRLRTRKERRKKRTFNVAKFRQLRLGGVRVTTIRQLRLKKEVEEKRLHLKKQHYESLEGSSIESSFGWTLSDAEAHRAEL